MGEQQTVRVRFEPDGRTAVVAKGATLLDAAQAAGVGVDAPCGGSGRCGSCRVLAEGALSPLTRDEEELLGAAGIRAGKRLACRARALGDVTVRVSEAAARDEIVAHADVDRRADAQGRGLAGPAEEEAGASGGPEPATLVGAAIDVGTTTIVAALVDLRNGDVLATAGGPNAQRVYGADVMSRVTAALASGVGPLRDLVASQADALLAELLGMTGVEASRVTEIVAVGNTAMTSLLLGEDVSALAAAPYEGAFVREARRPAGEAGLASVPRALLYVPAGVSAFIGSDVVAGLVAVGVPERSAPTLFVDLGTNGEIVLAHAGELLAASVAAGPALEGATIEYGMRATEGAIERVTLAGDRLDLGVIGGGAPVGICGSGMLDLVAALLDAGLLDASGRLQAAGPGALSQRVVERDGVRVFVVDADAGIVLTQHDVRQVQLALAAVRTGLGLLLAEAGLAAADVAEVVIAGGFGYHVRADAVERLGLVPADWRDRVKFAGNTALEGARLLLTHRAARRAAAEVASRVRTLDLAAHPAFQERFLAALSFPE